MEMLKKERVTVTFDIEELKKYIFGGLQNLKQKRAFEKFLLDDPSIKVFANEDFSHLSHVEKYEEGLKRSVKILERLRILKSQNFNFDEISWVFAGFTTMLGGNCFGVHILVFLPALQLFGTPEQQSEWLMKAENLKIVGTYAQTELGHGTFIRGLQTTVTYDPKTKEFVINTPSITAYKFWPGGLGHTANFAVILGQLYSLGQCHGLHPFIVQLRDLETHQPMKGINIGDIGPKYCFHSTNNGFLCFDNVRIPLNQMLMKNSRILENGEFVIEKNPLLTYANMTKVRVGIVQDASFLIAQAATIATRYSLVRMQSTIDVKDEEVQILDHLTQQQKVFPAIAQVFAIKSAAEDLKKIYEKSIVEIEKGDLNPLAELHALSCCLKAVSTTEGARAVEICRLSCGGHGYLNSAGFNTVLETITAAQTYEGENTVLLLQTGRFLLKSWQQFVNGEEISSTLNYFNNPMNTNIFDDTPENLLLILQKASTSMIAKASKHYEIRRHNMSDGSARNESGIELVEASKLYATTFIMNSMIRFVRNAPENLREVLENVLDIFCCEKILGNLGNILQFHPLTYSDVVDRIQLKYENALKKFRKNAIGVVDSFEIHDSMLNSTLGSYDGNVYENIINNAKKSPLNQEIVNKTFHEYLKPLMKSSL